MQHVENITEELIPSKALKKETKMKEFREYLVSSNVVFEVVKCTPVITQT